MEINKILAIICVVILLFMLMNAYHKPTTTKVVTTQPNAYVVHTNPVYYPHYNPYKAQYYN